MNVGSPNTNPGTQMHHWGITSQYHTERQRFTVSDLTDLSEHVLQETEQVDVQGALSSAPLPVW